MVSCPAYKVHRGDAENAEEAQRFDFILKWVPVCRRKVADSSNSSTSPYRRSLLFGRTRSPEHSGPPHSILNERSTARDYRRRRCMNPQRPVAAPEIV